MTTWLSTSLSYNMNARHNNVDTCGNFSILGNKIQEPIA